MNATFKYDASIILDAVEQTKWIIGVFKALQPCGDTDVFIHIHFSVCFSIIVTLLVSHFSVYGGLRL